MDVFGGLASGVLERGRFADGTGGREDGIDDRRPLDGRFIRGNCQFRGSYHDVVVVPIH